MIRFPTLFLKLIICSGILFLLVSCKNSAKAPPEESMAEPTLPSNHGPMMMKEDPKSIKSVEGSIQELDPNYLVLYTKKNVSLKFKQDEKTKIEPSGEKLQKGMRVKIEIEHLPRGMRAKKIFIEEVHDL